MTRRKFIQKLIKAGSVIIVGAWWLVKKGHSAELSRSPAPRKFVRAVKLKKYPGSLRPLQDIHKHSKWSG